MFKAFLACAVLANGQFYSEQKQKNLKSFWPSGVEFPKHGKFYDCEPAYQDWEGALKGVHSPKYNISAVSGEPFGNANMEFPWKVTAGMDDAERAMAFPLISIPDGKKIKWWKERSYGGGASYRWRYPDGTVVAEMLLVKGDDETDRCFEVRVRTRGPQGWEPKVFRPFERKNMLPWEKQRSMSVNRHTVVAERWLPVIAKVDLKWLDLPFKESRVQVTSDVHGNIVPKGYKGNITNCMTCHGTVGMHAREFEASRDWYGEVRGGDTIFSFHIFDESCISTNGYSRPAKLNDKLPLEHWTE